MCIYRMYFSITLPISEVDTTFHLRKQERVDIFPGETLGGSELNLWIYKVALLFSEYAVTAADP